MKKQLRPKQTLTRRGLIREGPTKASLFRLLCQQHNLPLPVTELRFDVSEAKRRFRFDLAWLPERVALEIDGGIWSDGRHVRGAGFLRDREKGNLATVQGWAVLYTTPQNLCTSETIEMVEAVLRSRREAA